MRLLANSVNATVRNGFCSPDGGEKRLAGCKRQDSQGGARCLDGTPQQIWVQGAASAVAQNGPAQQAFATAEQVRPAAGRGQGERVECCPNSHVMRFMRTLLRSPHFKESYPQAS
jgi:hypothetical protein